MAEKSKKKKKIKKRGTFLMALGLVLMLGAACLAIYNNYENEKAMSAIEDIIPRLKDAIENSDPDIIGEEKVFNIDGYDYIGYLSIPSLDIETPVMAEWDYVRLKIAVCRYYGRVDTDDLIIAGHNYRSCFGKLSGISTDDEVIFTDAEGKEYYFLVGEIEVLSPFDTKEMIETDWELTLYTCTYGGRSRITVRCSRDEDRSGSTDTVFDTTDKIM